jgi:hypothetical protein
MDAPILSVKQPWASLLIFGAPVLSEPSSIRFKTIENRSWMPHADLIGQRIGIHASKSYDVQNPFEDDDCDAIEYPAKASIKFDADDPKYHIRGYIIGTVRLVGVIAMLDGNISLVMAERDFAWSQIDENDMMWFEHFEGMFGWVFRKPLALPKPIHATGQLNVWKWSVPENMIDSIYYPFFKPEIPRRDGRMAMRYERTDDKPALAEKCNVFQKLQEAGRLKPIDPNQPSPQKKEGE